MATDSDARDLARIVGDECADVLVVRCTLARTMLAHPEADRLLRGRLPSAVAADLRRIERAAKSLADLLYPHDTVFALAREAVASREKRGRAVALSPVAEATREIERLAFGLRNLEGWSREAARAFAPRRGSPVDQTRVIVANIIAGCLAMFGHGLSTGENAKLVRVARIVWPRMGFDGDPRDTMRRLVAAGRLPLDVIAARGKAWRDPATRDSAPDGWAFLATVGLGGANDSTGVQSPPGGALAPKRPKRAP